MSHLSRLTILLAVFAAGAVFAESERERQAREDLERQLKQMVGTPPTKVKIEFVGLDQPNYELTEASFKLDGNPLRVADLKKLDGEGDHLIFQGDIQPGPHVLDSRFEFMNKATPMISIEAGYKWKVGSEVKFTAQSGLEVQIKVTPELNERTDLKNRITIRSPATVKMLAKVDDGSMPPPAPKPVIVPAADAGVPVAVVAKAQTPAEKAAAAAAAKQQAREEAAAAKQAAAEEKKQKAEVAKAARAEAAAEKKRKAEAAKATKVAAAEEKKRAAEEAKAAKAAAAEEKKRAAEEAKAAKVAAAEEKKRAAEEGTKSEQAGLVAAAPVEPGAEKPPEPVAVAPAELDAGATLVAAVVDPPVTVKQVEPAAIPRPEGGSPPLPLMIGLTVAALGLVLFIAGRRKKQQQR